jgi:hypothetical protein
MYGNANTVYAGTMNVAALVATTANLTTANISTLSGIGGTLTGSLNVNSNLIVGNLFVIGGTTNVNTTNLIVDSNTILLAANQSSPVVNAYISVERGGAINTSLIWNETAGKWGYSEPSTAAFVSFDGIYAQANAAYAAANNAKVTAYANGGSSITTNGFNFINTTSILVTVGSDGAGNANIALALANSNSSSYTFTGSGSGNTYTLGATIANVNNILVTVDGVVLIPTTDYSVSGTTLTILNFTPESGAQIEVRTLNSSGSAIGSGGGGGTSNVSGPQLFVPSFLLGGM